MKAKRDGDSKFKRMLELMRAEKHYPHSMNTKEWTGMYVLEYGEKLATKDPVYKRVKN